MEILTPGKKIRKLRQLYSIKQKELAAGIVTPGMLSGIENDKYSLNETIAKKLCDKLNTFIHEDCKRISHDYLLISKNDQVKHIVSDVISNIQTINTDKVIKLKKFFYNGDYPFEQVRLFTYIGVHYYIKLKELDVSQSLLEEALDISLEYNFESFALSSALYLQRIYTIKGSFELSINLYSKYNKHFKHDYKKINGRILYHFALAFQNKGHIKKAIQLYKRSIDYMNDSKKLFFSQNNLGICYHLNSEYEKSNNFFFELLKKDITNSQRAKFYSNILINFIELNEKFNIRIIIPKLENLLNKEKDIYEYQHYYHLGRAYLFIGDRFSAMKNFEKELELKTGLLSKNSLYYIEKYEDCINKLFDIYQNSELNKIKKLEKHLLDIPKELFRHEFFYNSFPKFSRVYSKKELIEFSDKLKKKFA